MFTFAITAPLVVPFAAALGQQPQTPQPTAQQIAEEPSSSVVTAKLLRYAKHVVDRYDTSRDGQLNAEEFAAMHGDPKLADLNADGQITVDEFAQHVADYAAGRRIRLTSPRGAAPDVPPPGTVGAANNALAGQSQQPTDPAALDARRNMRYFKPLPAGAPAWFAERDKDGDAQLTLGEYSPRLMTTEVAEFNRYDLNGDGLVTPAEITRAASQAAEAARPDSGSGVTP